MSGRAPTPMPSAAIGSAKVVPFANKHRVSLEPGAALTLNSQGQGYIVVSGRIELYASFKRDGLHSGRHFLFALAAGEHIVPSLTDGGDLLLAAIAVEDTELVPVTIDEFITQTHGPEQSAAMAGILDGWLSHLAGAVARSMGPAPLDIVTLKAGERTRVGPTSALTSLGGVVWLTGDDAAFTYCGAAALEAFDGRQFGAVAGGAWLTGAGAADITAWTTGEILSASDWPRRLAAVHRAMLAVVERSYIRQQAALLQAAEGRAERTRRTVDRALSRFDSVLGRLATDAPARHLNNEPLVGAFATIAAELGIDLANRQRDLLARAATVDDAARLVRLRNRLINLRSNWQRQDLGPLLGFLDEDQRPVALIPSGTGRWHMVEAEHARPVPIDAALAARIGLRAHTFYPTFADRPIGFRQFIAFAWPRSRGDFAMAAVLSLVCALLGLATPMAMQLAFDRFIPGHQTSSLLVLGTGLVTAAFVAAGFRLVFDIVCLRVDGRSAGALQAAVMDRVLRLPEHALATSPGNLATQVTSADTFRRTIISLVFGSMSALFFLISNIAWMFYYSPAAAGAAIGLFAVMTAIAGFCGYHQLDALTRGEEIRSDIYGIVFQLVQGITALRATGSEQRGFARWAMDFAELRARMYKARTFATVFETALVAFELLALAVILVILAQLPRDQFSTGAFISFITAYGAYMGASLQMARGVVNAWNSKPSWSRVAPLLKAAPEGAGSRRDPGTLSGAIDLTNVYFRYSAEAPFALQSVSHSVAPGEFIALVGPSGSGKSTLVRLLLGFHMPVSGAVQYDQQDLRFLDLEMVRRQIGVVLQNTTLFPGTLYENIMGVHEGTMDDAWEAARHAGIDATIKAMPMGMHTIVTEASAAFSGGQIQRLAVARALVGKPRILLLDEATSAVDNVTQGIVTESLQRLAVTRIVIAHRLNTVKSADRILVIDQGKIVQSGRYEDLIAAKGLFADLARRQLV